MQHAKLPFDTQGCFVTVETPDLKKESKRVCRVPTWHFYKGRHFNTQGCFMTVETDLKKESKRGFHVPTLAFLLGKN